MKTSRRNFLRLAPASVGAIALAALPKSARTLDFEDGDRLYAYHMGSWAEMQETMLVASERAADPPIVHVYPTGLTYYDG